MRRQSLKGSEGLLGLLEHRGDCLGLSKEVIQRGLVAGFLQEQALPV